MERELGFDDDGQPVLITRAALSYEEQHRQRVRKYLKLMIWRIPAFLAAAGAYGIWHNGLLSLAILAASIPLPWMAVLIAGPPDELRNRADSPTHPNEPLCSRGPSSPHWRPDSFQPRNPAPNTCTRTSPGRPAPRRLLTHSQNLPSFAHVRAVDRRRTRELSVPVRRCTP